MRLDGLQPVWDMNIVDKEKTTADFTVGSPIRRETVFVADGVYEEGRAHFFNVVYDGEKYRAYYITAYSSKRNQTRTTVNLLDSAIGYMESDDGFNWERPTLGICEWDGKKDNNFILRSRDKFDGDEGDFFDNFFVFCDTNPNCDPKMKFKALAYSHTYKIASYYSEDGIHFISNGLLDVEGHFDTNNVCFWDDKIKRYVAYIRSFHNVPDGDLNAGIRDARRMESEDFIHWTKPELITFNETEDYPIYTNQIMQYYRNKNILIGFPTRYCERKAWSDNFEQLCGRERRLARIEKWGHPRLGLSVTDCIFMSSRDGVHFDKCDEAIFTPGPEYLENWIYGNCYPAYFMKETDGENGTKEISMLVGYYHTMDCCEPTRVDEFVRYTFRRDGFACYKAKYTGAKFVTKPFVFDGDEFRINFATSARGSVYITIIDEDGNKATTCELFGDSDNRLVHFEGVNVKDFSGKTVTLEFEMKDATIYSFEFRKG